MKLKILSSSSKGNGYIIESENEALIIEAGMPLKVVKESLKYNISKVVGCFVTHRHNDHAKYVDQYAKNGIPVFVNEDIHNNSSYPQLLNKYENGRMYYVPEFWVWPFELKHDVPCSGFIIDHNSMGQCLFVTDTYYVPNTFNGLSHIIIEANYSKQILQKNPVMHDQHIYKGHMEIDTTKDFLKSNDLSKVNNIVLTHLSDANSDAERFKREVEDITGKRVFVAENGMEIDFSKNGF